MRANSKRPAARRHGAQYVPENVVRAIATVVTYCWSDELHDYQSRPMQERNTHIFRDLASIRRWLKRVTSESSSR
jgi:hypothetical protein